MVSLMLFVFSREAILAEMGVALGEDGHSVGLFQPKKVCNNNGSECDRGKDVCVTRAFNFSESIFSKSERRPSYVGVFTVLH